MTFEPDTFLVDNYAQIVAERGITWGELADELDKAPTPAPNLSAWCRAQDEPVEPEVDLTPEVIEAPTLPARTRRRAPKEPVEPVTPPAEADAPAADTEPAATTPDVPVVDDTPSEA